MMLPILGIKTLTHFCIHPPAYSLSRRSFFITIDYMKNLINCENLTKRYASDFFLTKKKKAIDSVSFNVGQGEVFGIVGPNGAGKSTTLKILMGFVRQSEGTATIKEIPSSLAESREHIGYLPENPTLYQNLSARDHLKFACRVTGNQKHDQNDRITEILQLVNLSGSADTSLRQFSKGMMQRAGLAYALIRDPEILILDEPMSGLDPLGRQLVIDIIKAYHARGTTILFCSHILTDVERVCDRIAIMNKGKILDITTPQSVKKHFADTVLDAGKTPLEAYFLKKLEGTAT
jgi:ABC-2 type transport system ATP-binding protein